MCAADGEGCAAGAYIVSPGDIVWMVVNTPTDAMSRQSDTVHYTPPVIKQNKLLQED